MKHLKIYLAGKMNGLTHKEMSSWRKECACKILEGLIYGGYNTEVNIIDPINYYNFKEKRHQTEIEVEEFDLAHATSSDIIIVNLEGLNSSIGTIIELHDAHYHHKDYGNECSQERPQLLP